MYEAFGFDVEGTLRRYVMRPGGTADAHVMGRISVNQIPGPLISHVQMESA
ncbi:MAG: hypothetical protein ABJH85_03030 [Paracoccaceae bacterium]